MPQQRLLALDEATLTAYAWRSGLLSDERRFSADAAGLVEWTNYLRLNRRAVFSVFASAADESLLTEDIPYTRGGDRKALIERKLAQRFPGHAWKFALSVGRNPCGRRDETILMAALHRSPAMERWLAPLQGAQVRLAGIYTAPFLGERLAAELATGESRFMLVTLLRGGLKQLYFDSNRLRFQRGFAADAAAMGSVAALCADESAKLLRYLLAQRLIEPGASLPVVVLLQPRDISVFQATCHDSAQLRYRYADLPALATKHGLRSLPRDSLADSLFLHLMVSQSGAAQYAPPGLRRFYRLRQMQSLLAAGTATIVLAGLASAGRDLLELERLDGEQELLAASLASARSDHQAAQAKLPAKAFDPAALRAVVERIEALRREEASLPDDLQRISQAVEQSEGIELERIDWRLEEQQGEATPASRIDIHARLPRVTGNDTATQFAKLNGFATALRRSTGAPVSTVSWPAAIDPERTLGHNDLEQIAADDPRFILRLGRNSPRS